MLRQNVFVVRTSNIPMAGVGAFSCSDIPSGQIINPQTTADRFVQRFEHEIDDNYLKYCILLESGKYLGPVDFLKMGVFWYINHSDIPNLEFKNRKLWSVKDIKAGDELTMYYSDLLTHPKNKLWYRSI